MARKRKRRGPSLFDLEKAIAAKEQGMNAVEEHASATLKLQWLDIIHEICKSKVFFTTDDVVKLGIERGVPEPPEGRLFGSLMKEAAKRGWCHKTGKVATSERVRLHHGICQIWASHLSGTEVHTCKACDGLGLVGVTP